MPGETFFRYVAEAFRISATAKDRALPIHSLAHFDVATGALSICNGTNQVWRRDPVSGGRIWQQRYNGEQGVLFYQDADAEPFEPELGLTGRENLDWFLNSLSFEDSPALSGDQQRRLFEVALYFQFFPPLRRNRLIPVMLGPKGSGKTTQLRRLARWLIGPAFDVILIEKEKQDGFVAGITNSLVHCGEQRGQRNRLAGRLARDVRHRRQILAACSCILPTR